LKAGFRVSALPFARSVDNVRFIARDELAEVGSKLVVGVGADMVELVHGDQAIVKSLDAEAVHREAKVEAAGGADVEGAFANLLDRGDAGEWQEEAEMVWEVFVFADDGGVVGVEFFGLEFVAVGGEDVFGFVAGGGGAVSELIQSFCDFAGGTGGKVNVVVLEDCAGDVGFVGFAFAKAVYGGGFIAKGFQKCVGELGWGEWLSGQV